jgi:hypothetical protein
MMLKGGRCHWALTAIHLGVWCPGALTDCCGVDEVKGLLTTMETLGASFLQGHLLISSCVGFGEWRSRSSRQVAWMLKVKKP